MDAKKLGGVLLVLSVALLVIFIISSQMLYKESKELGCFNNEACKPLEQSISLVHVGFGFFGFILALGFYLVFLSKSDDALFKKLESQQQKVLEEEKFKILLLGLDEFEQEVIKAVKQQPGIMQNTLRLRVDMSKAKLSQVLTDLEKKKLIKRESSQKSKAIHPMFDF